MIPHKPSQTNRGNVQINSTVEIKMLKIHSLEHI